MSVELTSGLWYENVADAFEPESRLSMGLKEKPQMLDCQDYQITRVPPLSMLVNRLSKAPETSLMILSSPRAKRVGPKGLRAESARAVTGRRCPHSGVG